MGYRITQNYSQHEAKSVAQKEMNSTSWQNSERLISKLMVQYNINRNTKPGMTTEQAIC